MAFHSMMEVRLLVQIVQGKSMSRFLRSLGHLLPFWFPANPHLWLHGSSHRTWKWRGKAPSWCLLDLHAVLIPGSGQCLPCWPTWAPWRITLQKGIAGGSRVGRPHAKGRVSRSPSLPFIHSSQHSWPLLGHSSPLIFWNRWMTI